MLVPPPGQRIVDIDQFLGQLVELEPALAVAIDRGPRRRDRLARPVAEVEPGAGKRGIGLVPQARLVERGDQPGVPVAAAFVIIRDSSRP